MDEILEKCLLWLKLKEVVAMAEIPLKNRKGGRYG